MIRLLAGWAKEKLVRYWKQVFYPWDTEPPAPITWTPPTNSEAPRKLSDWTLDFALDELQRCYDNLGPAIAPADIRLALPMPGCVSDSIDATVRSLRGRIQSLEVENRLLRAEVDPDGHL